MLRAHLRLEAGAGLKAERVHAARGADSDGASIQRRRVRHREGADLQRKPQDLEVLRTAMRPEAISADTSRAAADTARSLCIKACCIAVWRDGVGFTRLLRRDC